MKPSNPTYPYGTTSPIPINRIPLNLGPDPKMVMARYFNNGEERSRGIIHRLLQLNSDSVKQQLSYIVDKFKSRHRNYLSMIHNSYKNVKYIATEEADALGVSLPLPMEIQYLIGSYFTMEYSIAAGALFNPSIIPAPGPKNLPPNYLEFILTLRAVGEGHISSIIFRTGHYAADKDQIYLDNPALPIKTPSQERIFDYEKEHFDLKLKDMGINDTFRKNFIDCIENNIFSYQDFQIALSKFQKKSSYVDDRDEKFWLNKIKWLAESHLELLFHETNQVSERVIFPIAEHERNGIEDARFVQFFDGNRPTYYGTYTAYDGRVIMPKLIHTDDFEKFDIRPLSGKKTHQKNFALFPRKINGKYAMLSRLDGHNHYLMFSDNIYHWDHAEIIPMEKQLWELVQVGNCGSPLETSEGWLMINHGVGPMREYCLGATLLDLDNPRKVIATLPYPLIIPYGEEREGYVPNVVYTCGSLIFKGKLLMPYACSDTRINFATLSIDDLLEELKHHCL